MLWGAHDLSIEARPFWELSLEHWDTMFTAGVRVQMVTSHFTIPLLRENEHALIVHTEPKHLILCWACDKAPASDLDIMEKNGQVLRVGDLAKE